MNYLCRHIEKLKNNTIFVRKHLDHTRREAHYYCYFCAFFNAFTEKKKKEEVLWDKIVECTKELFFEWKRIRLY